MDARNHLIKTTNVQIFQFNPDWETFYALSFNDKLNAVYQGVMDSQGYFYENHNIDDVCLIVIPDLIFCPSLNTSLGAYSEEEYIQLEVMLSKLQLNLLSQTLVVPGAIQWLCDDGYRVTSYFVTQEKIQTYDKKCSSGNLVIDHQSIPMLLGVNPGITQFKGLNIGLEICQDHQMKALKNDLLPNQYVDVHILIANGQNINIQNIAVRPNKGLFVVCELEPGRKVNLDLYQKTLEENNSYFVTTHTVPAAAKKPVRITASKMSDNDFRYRSTLFSNAVGVELRKLEKKSEGNSISSMRWEMPEALSRRTISSTTRKAPVIKIKHDMQSEPKDLKKMLLVELSNVFNISFISDDGLLNLPDGIKKLFDHFKSSQPANFEYVSDLIKLKASDRWVFKSKATYEVYKLLNDAVMMVEDGKNIDIQNLNTQLNTKLTIIKEESDNMFNRIYARYF